MNINCPNPECAQSIAIEREHAGMSASCPTCGQSMELPDLSAFPAEQPPLWSGRNMTFPAKGLFGKDHHDYGISIVDGVVSLNGVGAIGGQRSFPLSSLSTVAHITEFKIIFLVVFAVFKMRDRIAFLDERGICINEIERRAISGRNLLNFLLFLKTYHPATGFDSIIDAAYRQGSDAPLSKNWNKLVAKKTGIFLLLFLGCIGVFVFVIMLVSLR